MILSATKILLDLGAKLAQTCKEPDACPCVPSVFFRMFGQRMGAPSDLSAVRPKTSLPVRPRLLVRAADCPDSLASIPQLVRFRCRQHIWLVFSTHEGQIYESKGLIIPRVEKTHIRNHHLYRYFCMSGDQARKDLPDSGVWRPVERISGSS